MYRDQVRMLKDAVACELNFTNYEQVVKGYLSSCGASAFIS